MSYDRRQFHSWVRENFFYILLSFSKQNKMFIKILCALTTLVAVQASGDFLILHSPDSVRFKGSEEIDQSLLKEVFTAALGFTVKQRGTWSGIALTDPFNLPEAVVGIAVEGVDSLESPNGIRFPLNVDEVEETTWQALSGRLEERDNDNTLVRIYLGDGLDALGQSALGELKPTPIDQSSLKALSLENEEDRKFVEEVQLLHAIAKKIPSAITADSKPDVYWLVVSGLRPVLDIHGKDSVAAKEALSLLNNAFSDVSKAFMNVYDDKVLMAAFTNDASQVRHTRSVILKRQIKDSNITDNNNTLIRNIARAIHLVNDTESNKNKKVTKGSIELLHELDGKKNIENVVEASSSVPDNTEPNKKKVMKDDNKNIGSTVEANSVSGDTNNESNKNKVVKDDNDKSVGSTTGANIVSSVTEPNRKKLMKIDDYNISKQYSSNYPVIFNIFLWFGIAFFFSLLAICLAIADMDPGRDSIIYRMTSNRMKKDN